jgi:multisubunit Na+/H+ antiporter MnhF subunit
MEINTLVKFGCFILGLCVIIASIWVILSPPTGDEVQGFALMCIGAFMILIVSFIMQEKARCEKA